MWQGLGFGSMPCAALLLGALSPPPLTNLPALPPHPPQSCTHALKLRDSVKLGLQVQLELGADLVFPKVSIVGTTARRGAAAAEAVSSSTASDATPTTTTSSNVVSSRDSATPSDSSWDASASFTSRDNPAPTLPAEPAPAASGLHSVHLAGPWVAVQWQADPEDRGKGVLRADAHHVSYSRSFRLGRKADWWAVPFDASLSLTYSGECLGRRLSV